MDIDIIANAIDKALQEENNEYKNKRSSDRLKPLKLYQLKQGAFEKYKTYSLTQGMREGQFKPLILLYKKDLDFNISEHCIL